MATIDFGATMWGRSWLRVVEPLNGTPNPQLPRARRLARDAEVVVGQGTGVISAQVEDAGSTLHVTVIVPMWGSDEAETAQALLHEHEGGSVGGELPQALFDELMDRGVTIGVPLDRLECSCPCRSRNTHCAHVLACIYASVLVVDQRPISAYELRSPVPFVEPEANTDWASLSSLSSAGFFG